MSRSVSKIGGKKSLSHSHKSKIAKGLRKYHRQCKRSLSRNRSHKKSKKSRSRKH